MTSLLLLFALTAVVLLGIEWTYKSVMARIGAMLLALIQLWITQPSPHAAVRAVIGLSRDQRVTKMRSSDPDTVSDYASGVLTMEQAMEREISFQDTDRYMAISVLLWLALTPGLRRWTAKRGSQSIGSEQTRT